jgi:integrase/recombinase XerD
MLLHVAFWNWLLMGKLLMELAKSFIEKLESDGDYSSNTLQAYSSDIRRFLRFIEKRVKNPLQTSEINSKQIKQFLEEENRSGFSASTLHRRKISLTHFAKFLSENGLMSESQVDDVFSWRHSLWKEIYRREIPVLTENEIEQLYNRIDNNHSRKAVRDLSIISLILDTGLSVNEVISIDLSDLDLRNQELAYRKNSVRVNYSIKRSAGLIEKYLKNERPELTQSMNETALFVSQMGGRISRQGVWQLVREWGKNAGISMPLSPRVLRNTAAMLMVSAGYSIAEMQKRLGHSNRYSTRALVRKIKKNIQEKVQE